MIDIWILGGNLKLLVHVQVVVSYIPSSNTTLLNLSHSSVCLYRAKAKLPFIYVLCHMVILILKQWYPFNLLQLIVRHINRNNNITPSVSSVDSVYGSADIAKLMCSLRNFSLCLIPIHLVHLMISNIHLLNMICFLTWSGLHCTRSSETW